MSAKRPVSGASSASASPDADPALRAVRPQHRLRIGPRPIRCPDVSSDSSVLLRPDTPGARRGQELAWLLLTARSTVCTSDDVYLEMFNEAVQEAEADREIFAFLVLALVGFAHAECRALADRLSISVDDLRPLLVQMWNQAPKW